MNASLLRALAFLALAASASAEIIGIEQFDYPDGTIATKSGGTFWDYKNFTPTVGHTGTASDWDDVSGAPVVTNGRLVTDNSSAKREYNGPGEGFPPSDEADGAVNDPASVPSSVAKSVYYRVTLTTGATVPVSFGLSSYDFGSEKLFFGRRNDQPKFGIAELGVSGTDSTTTPDILTNTTYTLVARIDYTNSPSGNIVSLHIDPDLNAPEPAAPAASRAYTGTNWSTAVRLASGTGGSVTWDNLVVATTWDDLGTDVTTKDDEDDGPTSLNTPTDISLREAVKYSPAGSLITFAQALNGKTCTLSLGAITIDKALIIDATALSGDFTIDGNNAFRHFSVNSGISLTLRGLSLTRGNGSGGSGGSILNSGMLQMMGCTLNENTTSGSNRGGGAISNTGTLSLTNCTLTGNSSIFGGAIEHFSGTLSLTHCTLSANSAKNQGGAIYKDGSLTLNHTIVAANAAPTGPDIYNQRGDSIITSGVNLLSNLAGSRLTAGPTVLVGDAKLSPLGYFGGPTQTMHPLIGSPAIDAGGTTNPGGTDQRGFPRFVDGDGNTGTPAQLDIGAVEAGPLRTVGFSSDAGSSGSLRGRISQSTEPGARIGFFTSNFPSQIITLNGTELGIPATANGLFIDASNLTGPVTISGNPTTPSRVFNIPAGA
ncbi:MAG: hypothetical protein H7Y36_08520, partial [Armatimonadetes bacterium]|nr:hypothetical protein [Akkermansiaceae bacterium]